MVADRRQIDETSIFFSYAVSELLKTATDPLPTPMRKVEFGGTKFRVHDKPTDGSGS